MKYFLTGGAGCIGSELSEKLTRQGHDVTIYDNFSTGKQEHLMNSNAHVVNGDILDLGALTKAIKGADTVVHLAAYSTTKVDDTDAANKNFNVNVIGTYNVLQAMRANDVKNIIFTSTQTVYGEGKEAFSETSYLNPISFYGASKAAGEQMIQAFCSAFDMKGWIFRFANVVGGKSRKTGGNVITDFVAKLTENPKELLVLGDGSQEKSYLTVDDCIDAILFCFEKSKEKINTFNIASHDMIKVRDIAVIVIQEMGLSASLKYTGGDRGWKGDVPYTKLNTSKISGLGWKAKSSSVDSVRMAARDLIKNRN